jgi:hypothetical protein
MTLFLIILILATLSGVFYRLGGWEKGNRMYRILGCPLVFLGVFWACFGLDFSLWWAYALTFGISAGMISAYWGLDSEKWGYWAHGLGLSLACLTLILFTGHWVGFALRTIVLTALITLWSEYTKWDILEEWGRGFIYIATIPILLI